MTETTSLCLFTFASDYWEDLLLDLMKLSAAKLKINVQYKCRIYVELMWDDMFVIAG